MTRRRPRPYRRFALSCAALLVAAAGLAATKGCASAPSYPNRNPVGAAFPSVAGSSLDGTPTRLPEDLAGAPAVLLVGYLQEAQFDIDRWLMGLLQADLGVRILELPTIPALVPTFVSGWIDDGMRSGIPPEDWPAVVTLYGEKARPVAELTGTASGRRARVIVLDAEGTVVWFDDAGYSARRALELAELVRTLR